MPPPPDSGDAPDRGVPRDYPTLVDNNGARHLDYGFEWLGTTRGLDPSVSFEVDELALTEARIQLERPGGVEEVVLAGPTTIHVAIGSAGETGDDDGDGRDEV